MIFWIAFIIFIFSLILYYLNIRVIIEWIIIRINSVNIEIFFLVDWVAILFIRFIFLISSRIILYSYVYIIDRNYIKRFIYLVLIFVFSIILIIIRPDIISILFGWDGLGLVSYCLVIFYQNRVSYNAGIITVLCNRIGDIGILIVICMLIVRGRWNIWFLNDSLLLVIMLVIAAISKRAQIPFSSWLPRAISAPTPVSALVHSSTLVTAGIYLIIRFNKFLLNRGVNLGLFYLSIITIFISGAIANVENDLKKIIALSTLSQLGLIIMILRLGFEIMAFYHLLIHAIFKSIMFICAGVIIHFIINRQDIRLFGNLNEVTPFIIIRFFISNMALCGVPFISGFYSKDLIIELIYDFNINIFLLVFILISLIFTVSYSFRLYYYIFYNNLKFYSYFNFRENNIINVSIIILVFFRIIIGALLNWVFFFDFYLIYLRLDIKLVTLALCLVGIILRLIFLVVVNYLFNFYKLIYFLSSIWFINYIYLWIYKPVNLIRGRVYEFDYNWIEFLIKEIMVYLIKYFNLLFCYKIYIFRFIFIYLYLLLNLIY